MLALDLLNDNYSKRQSNSLGTTAYNLVSKLLPVIAATSAMIGFWPVALLAAAVAGVGYLGMGKALSMFQKGGPKFYFNIASVIILDINNVEKLIKVAEDLPLYINPRNEKRLKSDYNGIGLPSILMHRFKEFQYETERNALIKSNDDDKKALLVKNSIPKI
jgi:hypothetical protein